MRSFLKMTWFELKLFSREPFAFFFTLAFPLVVLFIFGSIFGNDPVDFLNGRGTVDNSVPGYIGMIIGSLALLSLPVGLATYREKGILRRLRATPVSSLTIIGTQIIVHLLMLVIGVALLFAAGLLVFDLSLPQSFINMLIAVLIGSASFFAFGFLLAAVLPSSRAALSVGMAVFFPMLFLSGAALPREMFPEAVKTVGNFLPLTHVVELIKGVWFDGNWSTSALAVLAGFLALSLVVAARLFRWE
ncbi:MAG: ABC transporter permease [Anaerolineales bacterium]|nr:ABC transporter permease [Anaerolineales bacterium]MCB0009247.1 ABC transporter permease [Anaerolineales bacterium]MCB0011079.1 ABC transporter permease [Anaerolineales bacterium]MCB0029185.1 ABC transporter permease [Anaerolineales bacterium]